MYARNKHLIVNTSKSEVVYFNSAGENVPVFDVGGATLHHKDSFRYLGMVFYRTLNMAKYAEHAARPFLASAYRIRRFVGEHALADRPHTSLWLAKFSLVWITKAFNLEWLLNLSERGKPQNKPSKIRAVTQLENANLTDTRRSRQKHIKV